MRVNRRALNVVVGLLVPWIVYWYELGFVATILVSLVPVLMFCLLNAMKLMSKESKDPELNTNNILHTIPVSHYSEKIRWVMDFCNMPYIEETDAGIIGVFLFARRVPQLELKYIDTTITNSSDILRFLFAKYYTNPKIKQFLEPTKEAIGHSFFFVFGSVFFVFFLSFVSFHKQLENHVCVFNF